jgi:hypothetical protein
MPQSRWRFLRTTTFSPWFPATLIAVGSVLRALFVFRWHRPELYVFSDMAGYVTHARGVMRGIVDPSLVFQPMGYPLWLAAIVKVVGFTGAKLAQVVMGSATLYLVWDISRRFLPRGAALTALVIAVLHVPFIALEGFFLSETLFAFLLALLVLFLVRFRFPWSPLQGLALGTVFICGHWVRGNNAFFVPLLVTWAAVWAYGRGWATTREAARALWWFAVACAVGLLLHGVVARRFAGEFRFGSANAALNFMEGKCPWTSNLDSTGVKWASPLFIQLGEGEEVRWPVPFTNSRFFWRVGTNCVTTRPTVLIESLRYIYYLFVGNQLWPANVTPFAGLARVYGLAFGWPAMIAACWGLLAFLGGRRPEMDWLWLHVLSCFLCAWFFKSEIRFRVPFDVVLIPLLVSEVTIRFSAITRRGQMRPAAGGMTRAISDAS